jgi:penicillin-binding protein 1B
MSIKVKLGNGDDKRSLLWRLVRALLILIVFVAAIGGCVFGYYYHEYRGLVEERLAKGPLLQASAQVFAAPQEVRPGQHLSAASIAAALRRAGYNGDGQLGSFEMRGDAILIKPGAQSYLATDGATITTTDGVVKSFTA